MGKRKRRQHPPSRGPETEAGPATKRAKPKSPKLNLDDINNHCLVEIFQHLDVDDLLAVAQTSNVLAIAAKTAYRVKFGNKSGYYMNPSYKNSDDAKKCKKILFTVTDDCVRSFDWKYSLQFLRSFGQFISHLTIDFGQCACCASKDTSRRLLSHLIEYANRYSSATLTKLHIDDVDASNVFDCITEQPFTSVEVLRIRNCNMSSVRFQWMFPKLQHLKYVSDDFRCITKHFPDLISLDVKPFNFNLLAQKKQTRKMRTWLTNALRLNPELRQLTIYLNDAWDIQFMCNASNYLTSLNTLHIFGGLSSSRPRFQTVHFYTVRNFKCTWCDLMPFPMFRFENLEELTLQLHLNGIESCNKVYSFVRWHPFLATLNADMDFFYGMNNVSQVLPSIQTIQLAPYDWITTTDIDEYFNPIQTLKELKFFASKAVFEELEKIEASHSLKWHIQRIDHDATTYLVKMNRI